MTSMDALLQRLLSDPWAQWTLGNLLEQGMRQFYAFTLVVARMSGLLTIGPLFGHSVLPANIRIFLVLALAILITPALSDQSLVAVHRLDADGDGRLARADIPLPRHDRLDRPLPHAGNPAAAELNAHEFRNRRPIPTSVLDYARLGIAEFALGLALGLGVFTILTGLQIAGELIDQQTGLALGETSHPDLGKTGSVTARFLFLFGVTVVLVMEPLGGHLLMVSALVETFQVLPVGEAVVTDTVIELLRNLVHQSLVLALQVAAPLLATMSLMAMTLGVLGRTAPQMNIFVIGFPARALIMLAVLALTFSGAARVIVDLVPIVIDQLRYTLTAL